MVGTADSVLIVEVSLIQSVLYREAALIQSVLYREVALFRVSFIERWPYSECPL